MRRLAFLPVAFALGALSFYGCDESGSMPMQPLASKERPGPPYGLGPVTRHGPWFLSEIAYTQFDDGVGDIYIAEANGPDARQLTDGTMIAQNPTWSPDGELIAFGARPLGTPSGGEIYVMPADGSAGPSVVTVGGGITPCWLSDQEIVFVRSGDLFAQRVDGSPARQITTDPDLDYAPACSSDGNWLAFHSNRDGNWHIYVMDAEGSNLRKLTDTPYGELYPEWSPTGAQVAFSSNRGGNFDIYVVNNDGTGERRVTSHASSDRFPAWSRDGRRIAFESYRSGNPDVWSIAADGTDLIQHTSSPLSESLCDWSP